MKLASTTSWGKLLPNLISSLRILIGICVPFLLLSQPKYLLEANVLLWAMGLFIFGSLTDFWDGWLARKQKSETKLGRILDPTADKILILGTMASFAARGVYSHWYLVPIFIREIVVTFCRLVWLAQGKAVGAERAGKIKLVSQVISVSFSFFYLLFPNTVFFYLNQGFLILAVIFTVYSGLLFLFNNRNLLSDQKFLRATAALGVGFLPSFPGTCGSLLALLFIPLIAHDPLLHFLTFLGLLGLSYLVILRLNLLKEEDPREIVLDEACGIVLAFWAVPITAWVLLTGFLLFRFFDVTKIFPIRWLEERNGAAGIILDDIGAGIYTWLILKILTT